MIRRYGITIVFAVDKHGLLVTLCESGKVTREAFFERLKPFWNFLDATSLLVPWTPGTCSRSPDAWPGFSSLGTSDLRSSRVLS